MRAPGPTRTWPAASPKGRLSQAHVDQARARLHLEPELRQAAVDADLVIEAATESFGSRKACRPRS